ncbi:hypothetical protein [Mesorhizobium sp. SARCC-RB16n]|uniref:hypothetical protein n=1 Tax=Mesorhizobium sp. SARCC-RB16n TaxID=2116687 RepID=UPI001FEF19CE
MIAYASYSGSDAVIKSLGGQFTVFEIGFFATLFAGCCRFDTKKGSLSAAWDAICAPISGADRKRSAGAQWAGGFRV